MQVSLYKYSAISLASTLLGLIVIASIITTAHSGSPFPRCGPCLQGMCVNSPDECRYGYFHDSCGRIVCTKVVYDFFGIDALSKRPRSRKIRAFKGPDEKCGGPYEFYGRCGHGLVCKCNLCVGCSTENMECSANNNPQC
ncbi:neuroparsin-A-like isoform X1 [Neocloeon triangulifer]|uniref:neuroparsin-A-like isoform X1 n=1 Tax=Neocloeon triangulifer TaxID=2078957 RepID=UPI00286EF5C8|nr:neuroparsin-A-like isoform X1 [Neocloeon triangulifer]XP_059471171.1 neuroparsin-A-like isoform X1 [Neocloeon triangulifer]